MRKWLLLAVAAALPTLWAAEGGASQLTGSPAGGAKTIAKPKPAEDSGETCGSYGTSVNFVKTPSEAARQAQKEEKLVMVLHISGNFEEPDFT